MTISTEELAYWYFRLNGFFGNGNFIIHSALGRANHATEIDFLGMRFAYRKELYDSRSKEWMKDDCSSGLFKNFKPSKRRTYICLAEVKRGEPRINSAQAENPEALKQLFLSLGCIPKWNIPGIVRRLQKYGFCNTHLYHISFVAIGESPNPIGGFRFPRIPIITWDEVLRFIHERFRDYNIEKQNTHEWNEFHQKIIEIKDLARDHSSFEDFKNQINII
jgi:hypothetical protein